MELRSKTSVRDCSFFFRIKRRPAALGVLPQFLYGLSGGGPLACGCPAAVHAALRHAADDLAQTAPLLACRAALSTDLSSADSARMSGCAVAASKSQWLCCPRCRCPRC